MENPDHIQYIIHYSRGLGNKNLSISPAPAEKKARGSREGKGPGKIRKAGRDFALPAHIYHFCISGLAAYVEAAHRRGQGPGQHEQQQKTYAHAAGGEELHKHQHRAQHRGD